MEEERWDIYIENILGKLLKQIIAAYFGYQINLWTGQCGLTDCETKNYMGMST